MEPIYNGNLFIDPNDHLSIEKFSLILPHSIFLLVLAIIAKLLKTSPSNRSLKHKNRCKTVCFGFAVVYEARVAQGFFSHRLCTSQKLRYSQWASNELSLPWARCRKIRNWPENRIFSYEINFFFFTLIFFCLGSVNSCRGLSRYTMV